MFCSVCGERIRQDAPDEQGEHSGFTAESTDERYRITALVGRRPHVQLFLAVDTLFQRPVTLRDIDVSSLNEMAQAEALRVVQEEYALLRRARIPGLTPVVDIRAANNHLFIVGGWPFPLPETRTPTTPIRTHTLENLLQSGIGLPDELLALSWVRSLCTVVEALHHVSIVPGILDPAAIIVGEAAYTGKPVLTVSWLPQAVRTLFPALPKHPDESLFSAPEVARGQAEPRSDVYSLGALLYLLLTGVAPEASLSTPHPSSQALRDRVPRLSKGSEELVLRALATNPAERFQSAGDMSEALYQHMRTIMSRQRTRATKGNELSQRDQGNGEQDANETGEATVSVVPIRAHLARWHISRQDTRDMSNDIRDLLATSTRQVVEPSPIAPAEEQQAQDNSRESSSTSTPIHDEQAGIGVQRATPIQETQIEDIPTNSFPAQEMPQEVIEPATSEPQAEMQSFASPAAEDGVASIPSSRGRRTISLRERVIGILPALAERSQSGVQTAGQPDERANPSWLARLQSFLVGKPRQHKVAAALIETPLRVQPNQSYTIRIHLMGRNALTPPGAVQGAQEMQVGGLSSLKHEDVVHIEVRSAIYQNYAYVVQRADVQIPGEGFAAEVTIPMQPLTGGQSGRRERLHVFFMNELRQPLYEKPFALEVFISSLVQAGREGHNVLTIPV
jgi:hypothetical protein